MVKRTTPIDPDLHTKPARKRAAKKLFAEDTSWTRTLAQATTLAVHVSVGSKRTNTKRVCPANVAEIHYQASDLGGMRYLVVTLRDGRVCFLAAKWHVSPDGSVAAVTTTVEAWVSHDLEHLWWYAVPESARQAFLLAIRVRERELAHA